MIVAITGTPGCGKTEVCRVLESRGFNIVTVEEIAKGCGALDGGEVDVSLLKNFSKPEGDVFVDGHLAHHIPNDLAIVIRCNPNVLKERLAGRGYDSEKVRQNVEAEAIDLILVEALDLCSRVCEIDGTEMDVSEIASIVESLMTSDDERYHPGKVDWSEVVLSWY